MRAQIGRRKTDAAVSGTRMAAAIDADTDDDREAFSRSTLGGRLALDENAHTMDRAPRWRASRR